MASVKGKGKLVLRVNAKSNGRVLPWFDANIYVGGCFDYVKKKEDYVGGEIYVKRLPRAEFNIQILRMEVRTVFQHVYKQVFDHFSIWYALKPRNLSAGRKKVETNEDIKSLLEGIDDYNMVNMYVIIEDPHFPTGAQLLSKPNPKSLAQVKLEPKEVKSPVRRIPRFDSEVIITGPNWTEAVPTPTNLSQSENPNYSSTIETVQWFQQTPHTLPSTITHSSQCSQVAENSPQVAPQSIETILPSVEPGPNSPILAPNSPILPPNSPEIQPNSPEPPPASPTTTRAILLAEHPKAKFLTSYKDYKGRCNKKTVKSNKGESNSKAAIGVEFDEEYTADFDFSDESSGDDTDLDFQPEEEDKIDELTREEEFRVARNGVLLKGESSKRVLGSSEGDKELVSTKEVHYDSDDLRSVDGSDEEVDHHPTFNADADFKKPIAFSLGLKFKDVHVLRKAIQRHSIENHYVYYLLHNEAKKLTAYCRLRCDCPWDPQHSTIANCTCNGDFKCKFKIFAQRMKGETDLQIRSLNLHHDCGGWKDVGHRVTSEYLAERYLDLWKAEPALGLKAFSKIVEKDIGVEISYQKCWYARARAKIMLYGDASEEYAKVYDYGHALLKHNPGSSVYITTEGLETVKPLFQRMYCCLAACKEGFRAGCRPLIGVDGCHLNHITCY